MLELHLPTCIAFCLFFSSKFRLQVNTFTAFIHLTLMLSFCQIWHYFGVFLRAHRTRACTRTCTRVFVHVDQLQYYVTGPCTQSKTYPQYHQGPPGMSGNGSLALFFWKFHFQEEEEHGSLWNGAFYFRVIVPPIHLWRTIGSSDDSYH